MSKYISEFTSTEGNQYKLEVTTSKGNDNINIQLSSSPFITEMDSEEGQMYSPIKSSRATIGYLMDDYIFDLYSENPIGTSVKLENLTTGAIEWVGYITPQMFSQGFELGLNEIEIEAVDCLAVLEDLKFKSEDKKIVSFESLFRKILSQINIKYLWVSDNVYLDNEGTILDKLYISELNFFDKKDSDETDDDVCWKCKEIIYEMCQYLGYVAVQYGENIYLLDYDAIKTGKNVYYYRYDLTNPSRNPVRTIVYHSKHIIGSDHYSNDATVSLDTIYNKITVTADTYSFNDLTSNIETNITDTNIASFSFSRNPNLFDYIWAEVFPSDEDQSKAMDVFINAYNDGKAGYPRYTYGEHNYFDFVVMKFLSKGNTKFWLYDRKWNDITSMYDKAISFYDMQRINGCIYVKYYAKNIEKVKIGKANTYPSELQKKWKEYYDKVENDETLNSSEYLDKFLDYAGISSISWSDAIIMNNFDADIRPNEDEWYKYPYYQITCEGDIIQGGDNSAIIIQGNYYWHPVGGTEAKDSYPIPNSGYTIDEQDWVNPPEDMFIPASVQWGNYWWNGTSWQNSKCGFKLNWMSRENRDENMIKAKDETIDEWKVSKNIMKSEPITNTVSWRFGTSDEGHLLTIPKNINFTGKPVLTIYRPVSPRTWKSRKDYYDEKPKENIRQPHEFVALLNLKFKSIMGDPTYADVNKTDTIYTNELENDSINEMDDISFKIHTFDNKENTYSAVAQNNGERYIDKIQNRALKDEEKYWYDFTGKFATDGLRSEEHLIYKLCKQYTTPSKILECQIKKGKLFPWGIYTDTTLKGDYIIDSFGTDYKNEYNNIKLLEKK